MTAVGTLYFGPYHEEIDTYAHEGYAARVMPDGTETSGWGYGYPGRTEHVGYRARCECGWAGTRVYPVPEPDPMACDPAVEEWQRDHIDPLVEQARQTVWPDWKRRTSARAGRVVEHIDAGEYRAAIEVMSAMRDDLDARLRTAEELAEGARRAGGDGS